MALLSAFNRNFNSNNINQIDLYYDDTCGSCKRIYIDKILNKYVYTRDGETTYYNDIDFSGNLFPLSGWYYPQNNPNSENKINLNTNHGIGNWKIIKGSIESGGDFSVTGENSFGFNPSWQTGTFRVSYIQHPITSKVLPIDFGDSDLDKLYAGFNNYQMKSETFRNYNILFTNKDGSFLITGSPYVTNVPNVYITGISGQIRDVAIGRNHIIVLKNDGTIVSWGDNSRGQINFDITTGIKKICAHLDTSFVLDSGGNARFYGNNYYNNPPALMSGVNEISCNLFNFIYITDTGVFTLGRDNEVLYAGNNLSGKKLNQTVYLKRLKSGAYTEPIILTKEQMGNYFEIQKNSFVTGAIYNSNLNFYTPEINDSAGRLGFDQFSREFYFGPDIYIRSGETTGPSISRYTPKGYYEFLSVTEGYFSANPITGFITGFSPSGGFQASLFPHFSRFYNTFDFRYNKRYFNNIFLLSGTSDQYPINLDNDAWSYAWEKGFGGDDYDSSVGPKLTTRDYAYDMFNAGEGIPPNFEPIEGRKSGTIYPTLVGIAPRWGVGNNHWQLNVGESVHFGNGIYRTVTNSFKINPNGNNGGDGQLYRLNEDLPSGYYYSLADSNKNITGAKVIYTDFEDKEILGQVFGESTFALGSSTKLTGRYTIVIDTIRERIIPGDSTHGSFVFRDLKPALVGTWWGFSSLAAHSHDMSPYRYAGWGDSHPCGFGANYHHKDYQAFISGKILEYGDTMFEVL